MFYQHSEIINADGQIYKVAKDILKGTKTRKSPKRGSFNDYEQRTYDDEFYAALERKKLGIK